MTAAIAGIIKRGNIAKSETAAAIRVRQPESAAKSYETFSVYEATQ